MSAPVRFEVSLHDPGTHRFGVRCELADAHGESLVFRLPAWIRGSYLVRDLARHVLDLRAWRGEASVVIERIDKSSFRVPAGAGPVRLEYFVHALDESVRKAFLDTRRGFFNGSSLFYCPDGFRASAFELHVEPPRGAAFRDWRVATSMPALEIDDAGFGSYVAEDYEALIDHPFELGTFVRATFDVGGISHALVLSGRVQADVPRVVADLARICVTERAMFGDEPALDQYLFLTNVVAAGYGGLEHRASTALICSRADILRPGQTAQSKEYRQFLGLCSHEYFHLWNVKRITAQAFQESDLAREAYTRDLWHYEGVTSYYDDLILLRAGLIDAPTYLDALAEQATRLQRSPARKLHTLSDASFEAWIKYYQPDEDSPNATVSYYVKGALVALCLDLTLRLKSRSTLDDVLRMLWRRYGAQNVGVPERGLEQVAQEVSGVDLRAFFDAALRSTAELPLTSLLAQFGVQVTMRAQLTDADSGGRIAGDSPQSWLGIKLKAGDTRIANVASGSPAARAGVSGNDVLIALDDVRVTPGNFAARVAQLVAGQPCALHVFRGDELIALEVTPVPPPADTWVLTLMDVQGDVLRRRKLWLGQ